jgi:hypothetical protein
LCLLAVMHFCSFEMSNQGWSPCMVVECLIVLVELSFDNSLLQLSYLTTKGLWTSHFCCIPSICPYIACLVAGQ